jgi:hypothetical protein
MDNTTKQVMSDFFVMKGLQAFMQDPDLYPINRQEATVEYLNCLETGAIKNSYYDLIKLKSGRIGVLNILNSKML